jgi:hypothetical protein
MTDSFTEPGYLRSGPGLTVLIHPQGRLSAFYALNGAVPGRDLPAATVMGAPGRPGLVSGLILSMRTSGGEVVRVRSSKSDVRFGLAGYGRCRCGCCTLVLHFGVLTFNCQPGQTYAPGGCGPIRVTWPRREVTRYSVQKIKLPNQTFMDWGVASDELLAILESWGVHPVISRKYPPPDHANPDDLNRPVGGRQ